MAKTKVMPTATVEATKEEVVETTQMETTEIKVNNLNQAISILIQAAELGRKSGINEWNDLNLISQSISLINAIAEQSKKEVEPVSK